MQNTEQTQDQITNLKLIENPQLEPALQQEVTLEEPIQIGGSKHSVIIVRKPSVQALRKIRISELLNGDVNSICTILPLCTSPTLTQQQINEIEPADIVQLGAAVIYFLQPKSVRAEMSLQQ